MVEDFFDIIYAMHVEMGADPGRAPKHAGQKKTYKAVSLRCNAHLIEAAIRCVIFFSLLPPAGRGCFHSLTVENKNT